MTDLPAEFPAPPRAPWRERPPVSPLLVPGVVLVILGIGLLGLFAFLHGDDDHAYGNGLSPNTVTVTADRTYHLSIPNGTKRERDLGLDPSTLRCTVVTNTGTQALALVPETNAKAIDRIASFIAPASGSIHVDCEGLTSVYVDDADSAGFDEAGMFLILGMVALAVGGPLTVSALRTSGITAAR